MKYVKHTDTKTRVTEPATWRRGPLHSQISGGARIFPNGLNEADLDSCPRAGDVHWNIAKVYRVFAFVDTKGPVRVHRDFGKPSE
jgi:hypothetical protein